MPRFVIFILLLSLTIRLIPVYRSVAGEKLHYNGFLNDRTTMLEYRLVNAS